MQEKTMIKTGTFELTFLDESAGLLSNLVVNDGEAFDFSMGKSKVSREGADFYQLGDVQIAYREESQQQWQFFETRTNQSCEGLPMKLDRSWRLSEDGTAVYFEVRLENNSQMAIEVGGLGYAMIFNQLFRKNTLDESHNHCVFLEPYIGKDAGYLQMARLNGRPPVLLVVSDQQAAFEAYRPLTDDGEPLNVDHEGFYEWTVFSKAYQDTIWQGKDQWNNCSSKFLAPGEVFVSRLKFFTTDRLREVRKSLQQEGIPTAEALPGYVFFDDEPVTLTLTTPLAIKEIKQVPAGALQVLEVTAEEGHHHLQIKSLGKGCSRLEIRYQDERVQTVNFFSCAAPRDAVNKLAEFHVEKQWVDFEDPYGRTNSFMSYDREKGHMELFSWAPFISGLSDEPGAGPNLLMALKNLMLPDADQIEMLEKYVDEVLWGHLQNEDYSIKASVFYSYPETGWTKERGETYWRAYNYPHQAAIYWCLYRLARDYGGLVKHHDWQWYLKQAHQTVLAMHTFCDKDAFLHLEQYGLMVGSIHEWILASLQAEEWHQEAAEFEAYMHFRYEIWAALQYPYGSEMPWDSTGQEEVYTWCRHFGDLPKAKQTVEAVMAYTPSIPHWGYNGNGRRYFDSLVYGKWRKVAREFHHYGSSLNAILMLDWYKQGNFDPYLLKTGYAGSTGVLCNIDEAGFGSMCYLNDPAIMDFEPYTSDYGQAFYGYVNTAGLYGHYDQAEGWLLFGGEMTENQSDKLLFTPQDAFHRRFFLNEPQIAFEMEAGEYRAAEVDLLNRKLTIYLTPGTAQPYDYRIKLTGLTAITGEMNRGALVVPVTMTQLQLDF